MGSNGLLGVDFAHGGYEFLQSEWWLLAVAVALTAAWALQLRLGAIRFEAGPLGAAVAGLGIGVGALLFAGTLGAHGDAAWPGLLAGVAGRGARAGRVAAAAGAHARARRGPGRRPRRRRSADAVRGRAPRSCSAR